MSPLGRIRALLRPEQPVARADDGCVHVCQLVHRLRADGVGGRVVEICNGLHARDFLSSCISIGPRERLALDRLEPRVEAWGLLDAGDHVRQTTGILRRYRVDLLHTHGARAHLVGAAAAREAGVRLVHTGFGESTTVAGAPVDQCIAFSPEAAHCTARELGVPVERVEVVPTGVDTERFRPPHDRAVLRQGLGLLPEEVVVGSVGDDPGLLSAVVRTLGVRGLVVGSSVAGGRELVTVPRTRDVSSLLGAMDIYVHAAAGLSPSLCLLEAMACGLAVVALESPGARRVVSDGENGLLAPDRPALEEAVRRLVEQPTLRRKLAEAARGHVERHHNIAAMVEAHRRIYVDLTGKVASF